MVARQPELHTDAVIYDMLVQQKYLFISSFLNILMTRSVKHLFCDAVKREVQTNLDYF